MRKNENPVVLAMVLCIITGIVAFLLATVNDATSDRIAQLAAQEQIEARAAVLPGATGFIEHLYKQEPGDIVSDVYTGVLGDQAVGYCVHVAPVGYGGPIELVVGINLDLTVEAVKIISLSETPGLGSKAQDEKFVNQYIGKEYQEPFSVIKAGEPKENEIVAISGATVTSRAVTAGINAAIDTVRKIEGVQE